MTSNVIVFVSLFLGILTGPQTVEVAVSEDVSRVEILLDDRRIAEIRSAPWQTLYDFGPRLTTHRLTAVAFDHAGAEIGRSHQLLNVPRARVEAELLLEDWQSDVPTTARLVWHSAEALDPLRTSVSLNGVELNASNPARIQLPKLDPEALHFLAADVVFPDREVASTEVVFGGAYGSSVETELTAVPLRVGLRKIRSPEKASGWLRLTNGDELPIVAVDDGAAVVAVVREDEAVSTLAALDAVMRQTRNFNYRRLRLDRRDRLRFVYPRPTSAVHPSIRYAVFPVSRSYGPQEGAIPALLAHVSFQGDSSPAQQLTNAIAVAGRFLVESQKRRAVVAVTTDCSAMGGKYDAQAVIDYLAELHVPLKVWQVSRVRRKDDSTGLCRNAEEITSGKQYAAAVRRLRTDLDRQQIVWVSGTPLPREIELSPAARGVDMVGRD